MLVWPWPMVPPDIPLDPLPIPEPPLMPELPMLELLALPDSLLSLPLIPEPLCMLESFFILREALRSSRMALRSSELALAPVLAVLGLALGVAPSPPIMPDLLGVVLISDFTSARVLGAEVVSPVAPELMDPEAPMPELPIAPELLVPLVLPLFPISVEPAPPCVPDFMSLVCATAKPDTAIMDARRMEIADLFIGDP